MNWTEEDAKRIMGDKYIPPPKVSAYERAVEAHDPEAQQESRLLQLAREARRSRKADRLSETVAGTENGETVSAGELAKLSKKREKNVALVNKFNELWGYLCSDLPEPTCEHKPFHDRKHSIDRCWPELLIAVEIEGWGHGMNNRYQGDIYKYNRMAVEGWVLLRCDRKILFDNPEPFFNAVRDLIERKLKEIAK